MSKVSRWVAWLSLIAMPAHPGAVTTFTDVTGGDLMGMVVSKLTLGDYDNDGNLDLAVQGWDPNAGQRFARIYKNIAGSFIHDTNADLSAFNEGPILFGDMNNDGLLDLIDGGWSGGGTGNHMFRNDGGGTFTNLQNGLRGMKGSDAVWADIDNDGDQDLVLVGESYDPPMGDYSQVYRNDGNSQFILNQKLPGVYLGEVAAGDFDSDGDWDLAITGRTVGTRIFRNTAGVYSDIAAGLPALISSAVAWADIDNDGDLDLALCGGNGSFATHLDIYRNDAGSFVALNAGLPAVHGGDLRWGDFDNDGDPDLVVTGVNAVNAPVAKIYTNANSSFKDAGFGIAAMANASTSAWGDYDNDGDLDLFVAGHDLSGAQPIKIYRNDGTAANTAPSVPGLAPAAVAGNAATFTWSVSTDAETPQAGLTYNLRVGTTSGGEQVMTGMSDPSTGARRVAAPGNVQGTHSWTLYLPDGTYYYSVQAIDGGLMPSDWSAEQAIVVGTLAPPSPPPSSILPPSEDDSRGRSGCGLLGMEPLVVAALIVLVRRGRRIAR